VLADRYERVRVMVCSDLLAAAAQVALAVVVLLSGPVVLMIVLAAITAIAITPYESAVAAIIPQVVEEDDLAAANTLRGVVENVVQVAGPAIGALLLLLVPAWSVFALDAATYLGSVLLLRGMRTRSRPVDVTQGGEAGPLSQMLVGLREIGRSRDVALLVGLSVLATFVYGTDTVLFVGAAEERLGMGADGFGLLLTGLAVGGILAAGLVNRLARSTRLALVLTAGMLVYCLPNVLLAVTTSPEIAVAAQVMRGAGTLVVDVLAITALQRAVAPDVTARVFGVFWALILGAVALGALVVPPVVAVLGLEGAIVALAVAPALAALAALPALLRVDRATAARTRALAGRVEVLERAGIFAAAPRPVLERLAAASAEEPVPAGTMVVREGDPADALYVLRDGAVEVTAEAPGRVLATIGPGGWFGELGLLEGVPRTATVTTREPSVLVRIDGAAFLEALTAAPLTPGALEHARARYVTVRRQEPAFARPGAGAAA
jgi:MFS family permease